VLCADYVVYACIIVKVYTVTSLCCAQVMAIVWYFYPRLHSSLHHSEYCIYDRGSMENVWQGMGNASQPIGEVNYTPSIDIGEAYMPTEQQLNNLPPDVWH